VQVRLERVGDRASRDACRLSRAGAASAFVVCDWINAGSKEVASFVTMLTGSFKAYARIIAEQLAFGIAAQAVFEAPPLPAIRMNQQIKTLSVWESPGYGSRLFVTNDGPH
jgi:hypothetical protein